jgi:hypothetical protein
VYLGVGPEQNFTYIARLRPATAFVVDIRRDNLALHLLYKALFELSADRAHFIARLFSRPLPERLGRDGSIVELFDAFEAVPASNALLAETAALVRDTLAVTHGWPLSQSDVETVERALRAFADGGPSIDYWHGRTADRDAVRPSYRRLMTMPDLMGEPRSFLADEAAFAFVKDLQRRNMIVPVVGDVSGTKAMPGIAAYVRAHAEVVRAVYASNVAVYLTNQQQVAFCGNLALLPAARPAVFIDSAGVSPLAAKLAACKPRPAEPPSE